MSKARHDAQKKSCRASGGMIGPAPVMDDEVAEGEAPAPKAPPPAIMGKKAKKRMDRPMPFARRASGGRAEPFSSVSAGNPMMGTAGHGSKG